MTNSKAQQRTNVMQRPQNIQDFFTTILDVYKIANPGLAVLTSDIFMNFMEVSYTQKSIQDLQDFLKSLTIEDYIRFAIFEKELPNHPKLEINPEMTSADPNMPISSVVHGFIAYFIQQATHANDNSNVSDNPLSTKLN
jgi:hypothetical protein